jgi:hypothetical protein
MELQRRISSQDVRLEGLTAVVIKNSISCNVTLCSPVEMKPCFGGIYHPHFQGWVKKQETDMKKAESVILPAPFLCWFFIGLNLYEENRDGLFIRNFC